VSRVVFVLNGPNLNLPGKRQPHSGREGLNPRMTIAAIRQAVATVEEVGIV
jgi:3-dehydroquinate dehydratase